MFKPILRFAVMSDLHYTETDTVRRERFKSAMKNIYSYCDSSEYRTLDALYIVGDFTDLGHFEQMRLMKEDCDSCVKPETLLVMTLANHELHYIESESLALKNFNSIFGMPLDRHEVIKGYHFISLTTTNNGGKWHDSFDEGKLDYLSRELENAVADNAERPIFVFQHPGIRGTTPGGGFGNSQLMPILSKYPQVIDFSGHSHIAANDPREIDQKDFTAVSTGSLESICSASSWLYKHIDSKGYNSASNAQMLLVEADAQGNVLIKVLDVVAGEFFKNDRYITGVHDKSNFVYTDKRRETAKKPYFAQAARITVKREDRCITLSFPRACADDERVWTYSVCLLDEAGNIVAEKTVISDFMTVHQSDSFSVSFEDLDNTVSCAEIRANGFWGNVSDPLRWLAQDALNTDKEVIFVSHMGIDMMTNSYETTVQFGNELRDIIIAYQNKTAYSAELTSVWGDTVKFEADFANTTGKIISYQFGHQHLELTIYDYDVDLWQISTPSSRGVDNSIQSLEKLQTSSVNVKTLPWRVYTRAYNSESEASFNVMSVSSDAVYRMTVGPGRTEKLIYPN